MFTKNSREFTQYIPEQFVKEPITGPIKVTLTPFIGEQLVGITYKIYVPYNEAPSPELVFLHDFNLDCIPTLNPIIPPMVEGIVNDTVLGASAEEVLTEFFVKHLVMPPNSMITNFTTGLAEFYKGLETLLFRT